MNVQIVKAFLLVDLRRIKSSKYVQLQAIEVFSAFLKV